jgi:hypothetical protein
MTRPRIPESGLTPTCNGAGDASSPNTFASTGRRRSLRFHLGPEHPTVRASLPAHVVAAYGGYGMVLRVVLTPVRSGISKRVSRHMSQEEYHPSMLG